MGKREICMKILPFDIFVIHTEKSIPEIKKKLNEHIDDKHVFNFLYSNKQYEGEIYENGFKVSRIISYRNSFLPVLHGSFKENKKGTDIIIKMKLHKLVSVFMIIGIFAFSFGAVSSALEKDHNFIPLVFLIVFVSIIPFAFHWEGEKAKNYFNDLFNQ